jgi:hypothetical protein
VLLIGTLFTVALIKFTLLKFLVSVCVYDHTISNRVACSAVLRFQPVVGVGGTERLG